MSLASNARGAFGERRAREWYTRNGYVIVDRNWRTRAGEIDIVVHRDDVIVFVEVKSRADDTFGTASEAITRVKAARLRRLAQTWLATHDVHAPTVRFDVVAVTGATVEVIHDALQW